MKIGFRPVHFGSVTYEPSVEKQLGPSVKRQLVEATSGTAHFGPIIEALGAKGIHFVLEGFSKTRWPLKADAPYETGGDERKTWEGPYLKIDVIGPDKNPLTVPIMVDRDQDPVAAFAKAAAMAITTGLAPQTATSEPQAATREFMA